MRSSALLYFRFSQKEIKTVIAPAQSALPGFLLGLAWTQMLTIRFLIKATNAGYSASFAGSI